MATIYKYYSPIEYNFDALVKSYFYFSFAQKLNDPFDCSAKLFFPFKKFIERVGLNGYMKEAEEKMKNYATCSFSKDNDNKILWGTYAANYSGFCVGFDESQIPSQRQLSWEDNIPCLPSRDCIEFNNNYSHCSLCPYLLMVKGDVCYFDKLRNLDASDGEVAVKNISNEGVMDHPFTQVGNEKIADDVFISLCFTKEKSWALEKEYRLLVGNHTDTLCKNFRFGDGLKIPFEKGWVKEIILGYNISLNNNLVVNSLIAVINLYTDAQFYITKPSEAWKIRIEPLDKNRLLNDLVNPIIDLRDYYIEH